jgi:hypothetical protein
MKIERYKKPISSFLSVDKDIETILGKMYENPRLKRLLYREGANALDTENLTPAESADLLRKHYITPVPDLPADEESKILSKVIVSFNRFTPSATNPHFRDNYIIIDILCLFEQWQLSNGSLRPFKIAGEIDAMLDGARLSGIGILNFVGANYISTKDGYGGYSLVYRATHSEDDKEGFNNPADEERFLEDFEAGLNG